MAKRIDIFSKVKNFMKNGNDSESFDYDEELEDEDEEMPKEKPKKGKKRGSPELLQPVERASKRNRKMSSSESDSNALELESEAESTSDREELEKSADPSSDSDSDVYEAPVSKFNDPSIALEVVATMAQYTRGRGRGRGKGRGKATVTPVASVGSRGRGRGRGRGKAAAVVATPSGSLGLEAALALAMSYQTSPTANTRSKRKSQQNSAGQKGRSQESPILIDSGPPTPVPAPVVEAPVRAPAPAQNVIATVDLSGGPSPPGTPIPIFQSKTVINLDNDDSDSDLNDSYDPDKVRLKIKFKGKIEVHSFRKHQKFSEIMKKLAKRENCKTDQVFLERNGKIIYADSSPHDINYRISDLITARVVEGLNLKSNSSTELAKNLISIKFQSDKWKKPIMLKVSKTDSFQTIIEKLAEEVNHDPEKIKLSFDGDVLELNNSPADEGLEGGEIFDCKLL